MGARTWKQLLAAALACAVIAVPAAADPPDQATRSRSPRGWQQSQGADTYAKGYREGVRQGEADARRGGRFNLATSAASGPRTEYRLGFADGYRAGYDRLHATLPSRSRQAAPPLLAQRAPHRESAFAAGYEDGYARGLGDGREGDRYDPVRHRDYRDAERGYGSGYGSKEAYRDNYRAGFRQGYEHGYRAGTRSR